MTRLTQIIVVTVILLFLALLLLLLLARSTVASTSIVCLTHEQARERWPHSHLYWHTVAHCWDTSHKWYRRDIEPRRHNDESDPHIHVVKENEFNLLNAQAGSQATWPRAFGPWQDRISGAFKQ